jgi:hypothetical protein
MKTPLTVVAATKPLTSIEKEVLEAALFGKGDGKNNLWDHASHRRYVILRGHFEIGRIKEILEHLSSSLKVMHFEGMSNHELPFYPR